MHKVKWEKPIVKRLTDLSALMLSFNLEVGFGTGCQFASLKGFTTDISKAMGLKSFTSDPAYLTSIKRKNLPRVRKTMKFALNSFSLPFPTLPEKYSRRTGKFMAGIGGQSE